MRTKVGVLPLRMMTVALGVALLPGCDREAPRRLSVDVDTLVLYGYERTPLPVRGLVRSGEFTLTRRNLLRLSSDTAVEGRHGWLRCRKTGSATAMVTVGDENVRFTVRCRPAVRVIAPSFRWMEPGGPAQPLSVEATLETGERVQLSPVQVDIEPAHVARVTRNAVVPMSVGLARAHADYGGLTVRSLIGVRDVVAQDTLSLRPGEFRTWSLPRGRYEVTVQPVRAGDALQWFDLAAEGTRCSRMERTQETIYCVVYDRADLGVRNVAREAAGMRRQAFVRVVRTP
ncbi:MAG: hypothetical protein ACYC1W_01010 [Gemmatimonadaceae bacterium]